jgi:hypothetical protein
MTQHRTAQPTHTGIPTRKKTSVLHSAQLLRPRILSTYALYPSTHTYIHTNIAQPSPAQLRPSGRPSMHALPHDTGVISTDVRASGGAHAHYGIAVRGLNRDMDGD